MTLPDESAKGGQVSAVLELRRTDAGAARPRAAHLLPTIERRLGNNNISKISRDEPANVAIDWLLAAELRRHLADHDGALMAAYEAVTLAQCAGQWLSAASTPNSLLDAVVDAIELVRTNRGRLYRLCYLPLRSEHGETAVARVDHALAAHLKEVHSLPDHPRQRPRFFYFPGLRDEPYMDPQTHPWASRLQSAFSDIRDEAIGLIRKEGLLEDFVRVRPGDRIENYLAGAKPSWEGFFFYRHGLRHDTNHAVCPVTSEVLDSIELCEIKGHAPEILFSVLRPGTTILAHHGVTNVRAVMHLPLIVPPDCALNLVGVGEHHWREGELVMFDDTFEHEAWNRSDHPRVVLLMDCWNPQLTSIERQAVALLIDTMGRLHRAAKAATP